MQTDVLSRRTTVNIQEKANLIWAIADKLVGTYKPQEYGNVILPMCVIKRFSDTLAETKQKVIDMDKTLDKRGVKVKDGFLKTASGFDFYNTSPFTFEGLLSDAENLTDNFRSYLNHFSNNVIDIIAIMASSIMSSKSFAARRRIWEPMKSVPLIWATYLKSW